MLTGLNLRCSELEGLAIKGCVGLNQLDIHGLKLQRLKVDTCFINHNGNSNIKIVAPLIKCLKWNSTDMIHAPVFEHFPSLLDEAHLRFSYLNVTDMITF